MTLGFNTDANETIPANYVCTKKWDRGNLSFAFKQSSSAMVTILNEAYE